MQTCCKVSHKFHSYMTVFLSPLQNMTSRDTGASQDALISLIYRHLKDSGYKKAASVLRKHAPQVENAEVNTSLSNIFKKWSSEKKRRKKAGKCLTGAQESSNAEISDSDASGQTSPAKSKKVSSSAKKSTKKQKIAGVKTPSAGKVAGQKSPVRNLQKTSRSGKQSKEIKPRRKSSKHLAAVSAGSVSDSDSSLDVEKWTKLVSQLTDADVAKMEVLSNFVEPPVSLPVKSTETKKRTRQTKPKTETNLTKNGKSRTTAKKAGVTADDGSGKTSAAKTSLKKSKPAAGHETNGLVMSTTSEAAVPPASSDTSNSFEIPETADVETPRTSGSEMSSKKSKRKKVDRESVSTDVQTPSGKTANHQKNAIKTPDDHSETILMSNQSETPSKKAKKRKSKSVVEPSQTPKTPKTKKTDGLVDLDTTTSEKADVLQDSSNTGSPCREDKLNEGESFSEIPSKKSKKAKNFVAEPDQLETPSKRPELESSDADLLQSTTKNSVKKRKSKSSSNSVETDGDGRSGTEFTESPIKSSKSQATNGDVGADGLNNEETSSQDLKTPSKKKKRKQEEAHDVSAQEETTPEPKKAKKKKNKDGGNPVEEQPPEAVLVTIVTDQKKKKKKKEKERDEEIDEDPSVAEEVTVHKKKKKSYKEKHEHEASGLDTEQ